MHPISEFINQISPLSDKTWNELMPNLQKATLKKGQYFVGEGEYASEIAFLESGIVRSFYITDDGKEYNKTFFSAPAIIGSYVSLISKERNQLPQQALCDCIIWRLNYSTIEVLSEENYELERLRRKIAERFFVANERKQLEMALLEAKDRYAIFTAEHPGLEEIIPQYHIASYLGITATQLSRIRRLKP